MRDAIFRRYMRDQLARLLRPCDTVIMDNLSAHEVSGMAELIQARRANLLYLPAYSPDLNPTELLSAKLNTCSVPLPLAPSVPRGTPSDSAPPPSAQTSAAAASATPATDSQ